MHVSSWPVTCNNYGGGGGGGKLLGCTCVARLFSHNNINIQSVLSKLS